jgi:hypothetical protein
MSEDELKDALEEQPYEYQYREVSCEGGDAVAGTASDGRVGVDFLIIAARTDAAGCDVRKPGPGEFAENLSMFWGPPSDKRLKYSGRIEADLACSMLDANGIENCGFPD